MDCNECSAPIYMMHPYQSLGGSVAMRLVIGEASLIGVFSGLGSSIFLSSTSLYQSKGSVVVTSTGVVCTWLDEDSWEVMLRDEPCV